MSGFVLHPAAFADLADIWEFIAEGNLDAADQVVEDIHEACRSLVATPHQGYRRSDLTSRPLRFWPVGSYVIAYAPDESPLLIIAVLHGRRSPRVMAALLRARE
jgi:plasmid stabilization system protein ParE